MQYVFKFSKKKILFENNFSTTGRVMRPCQTCLLFDLDFKTECNTKVQNV